MATGGGATRSRCGRCGREHSKDAWRRLVPVARLGPDQVQPNVTPWPAGVVIEVRSCDSCGAAIARIVKAK